MSSDGNAWEDGIKDFKMSQKSKAKLKAESEFM